MIENDPSKYYYVAQGMLTIDGIDDLEEMKLTDEAFDVLGFTQVRIDQHSLSLGTRASISLSNSPGREGQSLQVHVIHHAFR